MRCFIVFAVGFFVASPSFAAGPSFDCAKAKAPDEIAICADDQLAQLDQLMAAAYDEARRTTHKSEARAIAREGLAARKRCGSEKPCIMSVQVAVLLKLQDLGVGFAIPDWAMTATMDGTTESGSGDGGALPSEVGQCARTTIAEITSRFQADITADPDDGSAVNFTNGGHQVSYEKVQAIIDSAVGDPVLMCLVSIPQDCPPGDDRGKVYTTTDLRTQDSWTLSDLQHSCGGA